MEIEESFHDLEENTEGVSVDVKGKMCKDRTMN